MNKIVEFIYARRSIDSTVSAKNSFDSIHSKIFYDIGIGTLNFDIINSNMKYNNMFNMYSFRHFFQSKLIMAYIKLLSLSHECPQSVKYISECMVYHI